MTGRPDDQMPDDEALAAEYALGLLEGAERAGFEARLKREPALVRAVTDWQARFATMAEAEVAAVAPPPGLEAALTARLFPEAAPPRLWDRATFWRGISALSGAVAAVAVGFAVLPLVDRPGTVPDTDKPTGGIPPGTILMTHLLPLEGSGLGLAVTREPSGALQVRRVAGGPTPGRAQEVWLVLDEATPPISLGLLGDAPLTTLTPPPRGRRAIRCRCGPGDFRRARGRIADRPAHRRHPCAWGAGRTLSTAHAGVIAFSAPR